MLVLLARLWLWLKAIASRRVVSQHLRVPLPVFRTPQGIAGYMAERFIYRPDPLSGALDYYTHPETIEWMLGHSPDDWRYSCDCDDFAVYAYLALSRLPGVVPRLVTLVDLGIRWSHVVTAFRDQGGSFGVIDTNGLHYFPACPLPALEDQALLQRFGAIYPEARYVAAVTTRYPF